MTIDSFITEAEGYYNQQYNTFQKKYIRAWLAKMPESHIAYVFAEVLKTLPLSLRALPSIHELEKSLKVVKKERTGEIYKQPIPEYDVSMKADSSLITDILEKLCPEKK